MDVVFFIDANKTCSYLEIEKVTVYEYVAISQPNLTLIFTATNQMFL